MFCDNLLSLYAIKGNKPKKQFLDHTTTTTNNQEYFTVNHKRTCMGLGFLMNIFFLTNPSNKSFFPSFLPRNPLLLFHVTYIYTFSNIYTLHPY